jgi:hypothetical protein
VVCAQLRKSRAFLKVPAFKSYRKPASMLVAQAMVLLLFVALGVLANQSFRGIP